MFKGWLSNMYPLNHFKLMVYSPSYLPQDCYSKWQLPKKLKTKERSVDIEKL